MTVKRYDANGNEIELYELCRTEPAWAANRIRVLEGVVGQFVEFQISDYDRSNRMAKKYCEIRRHAIKQLPAPSEDATP
jgi:hypothetical protein